MQPFNEPRVELIGVRELSTGPHDAKTNKIPTLGLDVVDIGLVESGAGRAVVVPGAEGIDDVVANGGAADGGKVGGTFDDHVGSTQDDGRIGVRVNEVLTCNVNVARDCRSKGAEGEAEAQVVEHFVRRRCAESS